MAKRTQVELARAGVTWLVVTSLAAACSTPLNWVRIDDPVGDDHGPGSYRYPSHPLFAPGSLDLRGMRLAHAGDHWVLEVEFHARVRTTEVAVGRDERRLIFPQIVDLYIRFGQAEEGQAQALPGRAVSFQNGAQWHKVVVLSATPRITRRILDRTFEHARRVYVPDQVRVGGHRLQARIPGDFLTEPPVAVAVLVSAFQVGTSLRLVDRIRGQCTPERLTMPVHKDAGPCQPDDPTGLGCHFHGCAPCGFHPQIVDLLAPPGQQERFLSSYQPEPGRLARIPMMAWPSTNPSAEPDSAQESE